VVGAVIQFPACFFIGDALAAILKAAQNQVFGLGQSRYMAAVGLGYGPVRRIRQEESPSTEVFSALLATKADARHVGQVDQGAGLKRVEPDVTFGLQAGHGSELLS